MAFCKGRGSIEAGVILSVIASATAYSTNSYGGGFHPDFGNAEHYAVIGSTGVNGVGDHTIAGDIGVGSGGSYGGFPSGPTFGHSHQGDSDVSQAQNDLNNAYSALSGPPCTTTFPAGTDLGGQTLTPGVYCFSSTGQLTGTLLLDAGGDPDASFIFRFGTDFTTADHSRILTVHEGSHCNVYWQVGGKCNVGHSCHFTGNIVSQSDITLQTSATLSGRALSCHGGVNLDTTEISSQECPHPSPTPSPSPSPSPSPTPSTTPSATPSPCPTPTLTPSPTPTPTPSPTPTTCPGEGPCPHPTPTLPPCTGEKGELFNIECSFTDSSANAQYKNCIVDARFQKYVTLDGGEVTDDSVYPFNPEFEISCDGAWVQKGHAYRFTEIIGTRIQSEEGPFPALVLPRGALHEGPHSSFGRLELKQQIFNGVCTIYTGLDALMRGPKSEIKSSSLELNTRLGAIRPLEGAVKPGFINGPIPNVLKSPALRREIFKSN